MANISGSAALSRKKLVVSGLPPRALSGDMAAMRVLVVEDEKKTASFIRKSLQAAGFVVDLLHHGDTALDAIS